MEVLQTIHAHGDSRSTKTWNFVPSSQEKGYITKDEIVIDSNDDEEDEKRMLFGSHISAFSFKPESIVLHAKATAIPQKDKSSQSASELKMASPSVQYNPLQEETNATVDSSPSCSTRKLSDLPDSLVSILRAFPTCPLCLQAFPILSANGEVLTKKFNPKKAAAKMAAMKKATTSKPITGAARLKHVQLCAFKSDTSSEVVISLIGREQVRLDRNKRREHIEEVSNERVWKTLTGDAPPNTQVQRDSIKVRGRRKGNPVAVKPPQKGKSSTTSVAFKAGKRGGLNRASTLIMAPKLTRALVKQRCIELFGMPEYQLSGEEEEENVYDDYEETTTRCQKAATSKAISLGLGVGACSFHPSDHKTGALARLGMGYSLGTLIAQQYKNSR